MQWKTIKYYDIFRVKATNTSSFNYNYNEFLLSI